MILVIFWQLTGLQDSIYPHLALGVHYFFK